MDIVRRTVTPIAETRPLYDDGKFRKHNVHRVKELTWSWQGIDNRGTRETYQLWGSRDKHWKKCIPIPPPLGIVSVCIANILIQGGINRYSRERQRK